VFAELVAVNRQQNATLVQLRDLARVGEHVATRQWQLVDDQAFEDVHRQVRENAFDDADASTTAVENRRAFLKGEVGNGLAELLHEVEVTPVA
jgi:hypothetical protein